MGRPARRSMCLRQETPSRTRWSLLLHRLVDLLVGLRTNRLRELLPDVLPQKLFLGAAQVLLCTPINVGEAPLPIDGVEGVANPLESLSELPLMKLRQASLITMVG